MKALKIILIFVFFAGIISAIIYLASDDEPEPTPPEVQQQNFDKIKKEIVEGWATSDGWNKDLFDGLRNEIISYETNRFITAYQASTLRTTLKEHSINKVCSTYDTLLANMNRISQDMGLSKNCNGLLYIKDSLEIKEDTRINNVLATHGLYEGAKKFVQSSHYSNPVFDVNDNPMWISLASQQSNAQGKAKKIKADPSYSKIQHIEDFQTGLSSNHIDNIFNNYRSKFYSELKRQIKEHFQGIYDSGAVTNNDLVNLQSAIKNYKSEYGNDSELVALKNNYDDFLTPNNNEQSY